MNEIDDPVDLETAAPPEVRVPPPPEVPPRAARMPAAAPVAMATPAAISSTAAASPELRDRVKKLRIGGPGSGAGGGKGSLLGRVTWLPWAMCALLALTWAGVALRSYKNPPPKDDGGSLIVSDGSNGGTGGVTPSPGGGATAAVPVGTIRVEGKGYLVTARQISVSPIDVGGKVIELYGPGVKVRPEAGTTPPTGRPRREFEEGALYEKGDIIAVLDSAAYQAQMDEAKASLAAAEQRVAAAVHRRDAQLPASVRKVEVEQVEAQLKEARANKLQAEQEQDRQQRLGPAASIRELQQAQATFATSAARVTNLEAQLVILKEGPRKETLAALESDVKAAEADVASANARVAQAQWRVDNCTIKAPISGTVLTKAAEVGKLVNPMAFSGGGAICDLADLADLEADIKVAEKDISKVRLGMNCTIRPDAYPDRVYAGVVQKIMPLANRADNTVNVRVRVKLFDGEVPGNYLKPEMGAVVSIRE